MNKTTMNIDGNTLLNILTKYTYSEHGYTNANKMLHTPTYAKDFFSFIKKGIIKNLFYRIDGKELVPCIASCDFLRNFFKGDLTIHCYRRTQHIDNEKKAKNGEFAYIWCYQWSMKITNIKDNVCLVLSDVFDHNIVKEIIDNKLNK